MRKLCQGLLTCLRNHDLKIVESEFEPRSSSLAREVNGAKCSGAMWRFFSLDPILKDPHFLCSCSSCSSPCFPSPIPSLQPPLLPSFSSFFKISLQSPSVGIFHWLLQMHSFPPWSVLQKQPPLPSGFKLCLVNGRPWWHWERKRTGSLGYLFPRLFPCQDAMVANQVLPSGHLLHWRPLNSSHPIVPKCLDLRTL